MNTSNRLRRNVNVVLLIALFFTISLAAPGSFGQAQSPAEQRAERALAEQPAETSGPSTAATPDNDRASLNVLELIWNARWLMIPIIAMSVIVVAVAIERILALRRSRVMPPELVQQLDSVKFDSRRILRSCTEHPSTMATVIREILRKLGRPPAEVESATANVMQRESERLYRNVRTLNLAAAVTPLMGLLGTVWGMIAAFFATANLPVGANKAESLAEGIYFALVTTAAGLVVAIPAAILAHWLEGRIQKHFLDMEDLLSDRLLPMMTQLAGRLRPPAPPATPPEPSARHITAK